MKKFIKDNWPVDRTVRRIEELNKEVHECNKRLGEIDNHIEALENKKKKLLAEKGRLTKKVSNNTLYKNAMLNDLQKKGELEAIQK